MTTQAQKDRINKNATKYSKLYEALKELKTSDAAGKLRSQSATFRPAEFLAWCIVNTSPYITNYDLLDIESLPLKADDISYWSVKLIDSFHWGTTPFLEYCPGMKQLYSSDIPTCRITGNAVFAAFIESFHNHVVKSIQTLKNSDVRKLHDLITAVLKDQNV